MRRDPRRALGAATLRGRDRAPRADVDGRVRRRVPRRIRRGALRGASPRLLLGNTLAASLIWGINTIFLLDAGLSNLEAFAANAFFTAGMVMFEVPTGIVADMWGAGPRSCSAR